MNLPKTLFSQIDKGGNPAGACKINTLPTKSEGIVTPATVSFAARTSNLHKLGDDIYTGAFAILANISSYEILWEEIRLKGGAYDTGFFARSNSGTVGSYSYRDPNPIRTTKVFANLHDYLDEFLSTSPDLTKYVVGAIGASDTVSTPRSDGATATILYLSDRTFDDVARIRRESIEVTNEELSRLSGILKRLSTSSTFTVVAPRNVLEEMNLDSILEI